ncbi:MAG: DUF4845 domain-containing protein [Gammaproteobacteria bacterium]|nr:DUF4845 domain-containing protein [Gammaproteobacteria bacterium]
MRAQKGVTLSGFLLWSVAVIAVLLLGFKLFPAYYEYYSIKRTFNVIANDDTLVTLTKRDVESSFVRRATMEDIQALGPQDLTIIREGGAWVIEAQYSMRVPLFGNLSACMDFAPRSEKK